MGDRGPEGVNGLDIRMMSDLDVPKIEALKSKVNRKIDNIKMITESVEMHQKYIKDKKNEKEELYRKISEIDDSIVGESKRINFLSKDLERYNLDLETMKEDLISEVLK